MNSNNFQECQNSGLFRRLAAMLYDSFILIALFIFGTVVLIPLMPQRGIPPGNHYYQAYLLSIVFLFYCWFWTRRGQTLGMMAWGLHIRTFDNAPISFQHAVIRWLCAIPSLLLGGTGLLWLLVDPNRYAVHDHLSKTKIIKQ